MNQQTVFTQVFDQVNFNDLKNFVDFSAIDFNQTTQKLISSQEFKNYLTSKFSKEISPEQEYREFLIFAGLTWSTVENASELDPRFAAETIRSKLTAGQDLNDPLQQGSAFTESVYLKKEKDLKVEISKVLRKTLQWLSSETSED